MVVGRDVDPAVAAADHNAAPQCDQLAVIEDDDPQNAGHQSLHVE